MLLESGDLHVPGCRRVLQVRQQGGVVGRHGRGIAAALRDAVDRGKPLPQQQRDGERGEQHTTPVPPQRGDDRPGGVFAEAADVAAEWCVYDECAETHRRVHHGRGTQRREAAPGGEEHEGTHGDIARTA